MKYKCVIFDFDGTLADTEDAALKIYNGLAEKYEYSKISKQDLHRFKRLNLMEILDLTKIPLTKLPKIIKNGQKLLKREMEHIRPFDKNIKEILMEIKMEAGCLGIITSNSKKNVKAFMKEMDIGFFDFIVSSPLMTKESRINSIARKYGLQKSDILYVGDETRDILACKKAGVSCAAVTWGYNYPEILIKENPDYMIEDLGELLDIIR
ncbi:HAD-IA family hydrolase [Alkalibacter mobilis]|uniref:HAD-IA family hydrolase n=1 Tax=Alkalibacter mobilis TaxID=2787712 RepID=UPI00189DC886|nr:HAD-IA family hydrolase [Alkalibacter mobilis]MBF7097813.1 HAD-IA family hydrolase [Alkalibacter mobilis]